MSLSVKAFKINRLWKCALWILALLITIYVFNSLAGGYDTHPETIRSIDPTSKRMNYNILIKWQPRYGWVKKYDSSPCGVLFYPLILIDQSFVHREFDLTNQDQELAARSLPSERIHPLFRHSWKQ